MTNLQVVSIVPKTDLSDAQADYLEQRRCARAHRFDKGACRMWDVYDNGTLYGVIDCTSGRPIGMAEASGALGAANAGWWIDSEYRGQGFDYALVDALADYLKAKGYWGVGSITIDTYWGEYQVASSKLKKRFVTHFGPR